MNDVKLDNVQLVKHLGHVITSHLTDDKDIMHQTSMYNRKANAVLSDFKHIKWQTKSRNEARSQNNVHFIRKCNSGLSPHNKHTSS